MKPLTTSEAISHSDILGGAFAGASWSTWRAVLAAAEGLPLEDEQLALFRGVAERDPPATRVRELWAICGRRSGKDSIASAIATAAALGDYRAHLRPGELASVMCLACDRAQARIVHRYIAGYFASNPFLAPLLARENDDGLELTTDVEIVIATNSFRAVRGRTIACVVFDECAFWRDEASANPDVEVYNAILPAMATLPNAMLIGISTPYRRGGLLFERWRQCYGKPDDQVLVVKGASTAFNPTLPQRIIDAALERDPEAAAAEWLAKWRSDLADFVSREVVEAVTIAGRFELPPMAGARYSAFCDPAGGSGGDSFTLAVGHEQNGRGILDAVREIRSPFRPADAVAELAALLHSYHVVEVTGDRYAAQWPVDAFLKHGISYIASEQPKSAIYLEFLPLLNGGMVELLDNARLISQLCALERRAGRGTGREIVDHPVGAHDDLINSAAGALVAAAGVGDAPRVGRGIWEFYRRQAEALAAKNAERKTPALTYAVGSVEWQRQQQDGRALGQR